MYYHKNLFNIDELNDFTTSVKGFEFDNINCEVVKIFDSHQIYIQLFYKKFEIIESPILTEEDQEIVDIFYNIWCNIAF